MGMEFLAFSGSMAVAGFLLYVIQVAKRKFLENVNLLLVGFFVGVRAAGANDKLDGFIDGFVLLFIFVLAWLLTKAYIEKKCAAVTLTELD